MANSLIDFLIENPVDGIEEKVVVSERLRKFPFTIKPMTGTQFSDYQKRSTHMKKGKKVEFDSKKFNELIIVNQVVDPNLKDAEMLKKAGCTTPEQFIYKTLLSGEIAELVERISELSGFDTDFEEQVEEVKNS